MTVVISKGRCSSCKKTKTLRGDVCRKCYHDRFLVRGTCVSCGDEKKLRHSKHTECGACYGRRIYPIAPCVSCGTVASLGYAASTQCTKCYNRIKKYGPGVLPLLGNLGPCAICESEPATCIDHDHATNKVRGALCDACNRMLGCARDSAEVLRSASDYLESRS